jgi:hypothetical protein
VAQESLAIGSGCCQQAARGNRIPVEDCHNDLRRSVQKLPGKENNDVDVERLLLGLFRTCSMWNRLRPE